MKVDMTFVGGKLVYERGKTKVPDLTAF
jgi:hypothetical protein